MAESTYWHAAVNDEHVDVHGRFLVFAGDYSYPVGGWRDYVGVYDSMLDALKHVPTGTDWAHIVDLATGTVVLHTDPECGYWVDGPYAN